MSDKSKTYSVEGTNADLRHYLARLARKSRFFSRRIHALRRAVDLFVRFYNARQLRKSKYPRYPAPLAAMIETLPQILIMLTYVRLWNSIRVLHGITFANEDLTPTSS
jgi:hypothetical protein